MHGYNFTEDVRKVLAMAREEANRMHHTYVGTEHILLGFTTPGNAAPAQLLRRGGADPDDIRATIENSIRRGDPRMAPRQDLPYTSRAKKTLELAMTEARELRHNFVGAEHLLLGLIREEMGIAAQVLADHGVRAEAVRKALLENPPERGIDVSWQPDDSTSVHLRVSHGPVRRGAVLVVSLLWAVFWVYMRPDILNWRLLALLLVIVGPPLLLLRLTQRPRR